MWAVDDARVLKVMHRHHENACEPDALLVWDGDGAVRLLDVAEDDAWVAMLLERCVPGTPLLRVAEDEQDVVLCGALRRLWRSAPAGHRFPTLASMCDLWADSRPLSTALDPALVRDGVERFRSLPREAGDDTLLTTDLHGGNILAAEREPWLVIDPKPHVGDRHYDAL